MSVCAWSSNDATCLFVKYKPLTADQAAISFQLLHTSIDKAYWSIRSSAAGAAVIGSACHPRVYQGQEGFMRNLALLVVPVCAGSSNNANGPAYEVQAAKS